MPRLLDSGRPIESATVGAWLESVLEGSVHSVHLQAGYADHRSLSFLGERLGGRGVQVVRIVLGGNEASLTADAALAALVATEAGADPSSGLRVVSFSNALFHAKTVHVQRADGSAAAYIGSANFTDAALSGRNVEAGLVLDTAYGDDAEFVASIREAAERWFAEPSPDGVFVVAQPSDVDRLIELGIVGAASAESSSASGRENSGASAPGLASRRPIWTPKTDHGVAPSASASAGTERPRVWWKKLSASDAQRPPNPKTNPTGKLRLTKSRLSIDPKTFFRDELFGDLPWRDEQRGSKVYECTTVEMSVVAHGKTQGTFTLLVDHAPHRIADQDNIPTVLAWGPVSPLLRERDFTGAYVVIERDEDGRFTLRLTNERPEAEG